MAAACSSKALKATQMNFTDNVSSSKLPGKRRLRGQNPRNGLLPVVVGPSHEEFGVEMQAELPVACMTLDARLPPPPTLPKSQLRRLSQLPR